MGIYEKSMGWIREKLNPAQEVIYNQSGVNQSTDQNLTFVNAFEKLESVNRGVNMIVSAAASLDYDIKEKVSDGVVPARSH